MEVGDDVNADLPSNYRNPHTQLRPKTSQVPLHLSNASTDAEVNKLFPLYGRETKRGICVVRPGDMIYFPGCFFHEVNSMGRHLGINFWTKMAGHQWQSEPPPKGTYSPESGLSVSDLPPQHH